MIVIVTVLQQGNPLNPGGFVASHWFGGYVSSLCSPQGFFGFSYPAVSQFICYYCIQGVHACYWCEAEAAKINLMDCSCLCSEVEIA